MDSHREYLTIFFHSVDIRQRCQVRRTSPIRRTNQHAPMWQDRRWNPKRYQAWHRSIMAFLARLATTKLADNPFE